MGFEVESKRERSGSAEVGSAPVCDVCGETLAEREVVVCVRCSTPHHAECWRYNKGCSVYGCGSRACAAPVPGRERLPAPPTLTFDSSMVGRYGAWGNPLMPFVLGVGAVLVAGLVLMEGWSNALAGNIGMFLFAAALPISVVLVFLYSVVQQRVSANKASSEVDRVVKLLGFPIKEDLPWFRAGQVAELHIEWTEPRSDSVLLALTADGRRHFLAEQKPGTKGEDFREVVGHLAEILDCTIREFRPGERPSKREIEGALRQKALTDGGAGAAAPREPRPRVSRSAKLLRR